MGLGGDHPAESSFEQVSDSHRHAITSDLWLVIHDDVHFRPHLPERSRGYGLGGGLLAELITGRYVVIDHDRLHLAAGVRRPADEALAEVFERLSAPPEQWWVPLDGSRAGWPELVDQPPAGWPMYAARHRLDGGPSRPPELPAALSAVPSPASGVGQDVRDFLDFLSFEGRAEDLVVGRVLAEGLAHVVKQWRFLRGVEAVTQPTDWTTAGWPMARLRTRLAGVAGRLEASDLILAALALALGMFDLECSRLDHAEQERLAVQLRRELPPQIRELCRHVQVACRNAAIR